MKNLLCIVLIAVCLLPGCKASDEYLNGEATIDGTVLALVPQISDLEALGFSEISRQGCDNCIADNERRELRREDSSFFLSVIIPKGDLALEDPSVIRIDAIYTGEGSGSFEISGGIKLGKTTFKQVKNMVENPESLQEGNTLAVIAYRTGNNKLVILEFRDGILYKISI